MYKNNITYSPYHITDSDKIAVYSKLRARHAATGIQYFSSLRTSTTLAINGISDGIGEDMLHAATLGRLEADAYSRTAAHLMPLTLEAFDILLVDFGEYQKLERDFQYSAVQEVIDNDLNAGGTGRTGTRKPPVFANDGVTVTTDMVKTGESFDAVMLNILKRKSLVKIFSLYADGVSMADIADIMGETVKSIEHHIYRAKAKLAKAGIEAYLK